AVDASVQAQTRASLLGGDSTPASRRPFLGAGGGAAYILAALGARVFQGPQVVSAETDFPRSLAGMELALTGAQVIAGEELGHGVISHVADMAAAHAIPVIAVAGRIDASRGQLFKAGVTSAYPVTDISSARPAVTAPPVTEDALIERGRRLAKTWSR